MMNWVIIVFEWFKNKVDEILENYKDADVNEINKVVEEVTEDFVKKYNQKPDSYQLTRLANLILKDYIKNTDSYKVQKEEFPFHSSTQLKRRKRKEFVTKDETLVYMDYKVKANLSTAPPKDIR
jgi:2',3'-cyclic-nucleotide 2'-phosphodiesterase (5'-nucleotidase family)